MFLPIIFLYLMENKFFPSLQYLKKIKVLTLNSDLVNPSIIASQLQQQ